MTKIPGGRLQGFKRSSIILAERRKIAQRIYEKHGIRVTKWTRKLECVTVSTVPTSHYDFIERVDEANKEIRMLLLGWKN